MAKKDNRTPFGPIRGTLDGYVHRNYARRGISQVYRKPRTPETWSAGTLETRSAFARADAYFKSIKDDADLIARYRKAGRRLGLNCRQRAMRDCFRPPRIDTVDLSDYRVASGGPIVIHAVDDFEVTRVTVSLDDAQGGLIAQGDAVHQLGAWLFTAPPLSPGFPSPTHVLVTAYDRPGNSTMRKVNLPAEQPTDRPPA